MWSPRSLIRTAISTKRALLAASLRSLDRLTVPLLGSDSPAHRSITRSVQALDVAADRWARASPPRPARTGATTGGVRAEVDERAEYYLDAQQHEVFVGELADEDLRRVQAEVRAKQDIEDEHSR